jgi:hypothetical protein
LTSAEWNGRVDRRQKGNKVHVASALLFMGLFLTSFCIGAAKKAVRDWTNRNHKKYWGSTTDSNRQRDLYQDPLPDE